jgi:hypothetical protein
MRQTVSEEAPYLSNTCIYQFIYVGAALVFTILQTHFQAFKLIPEPPTQTHSATPL